MSRIDDLIAENCPHGVVFKPLGDLCEVLNGYAFKSQLFNWDGDGLPLVRIRDINTGFSETYYSGEFDDRYVVNDGDLLIGMDGDFRAIRWRNGRALLNQRVCRLQSFAPTVLRDFVYYCVRKELARIQHSTQESTVKHLSSKELVRARIAVPPVDVQREIVTALDNFAGLEAELEAQLEAESVGRRRQYEYYRDSLLAFVDSEEVLWTTMGDVGAFTRGRRFTKNDVVPEGIGSIHYGEIYTHYGTSTTKTVSRVRSELAPRLRFARTGDVVIAAVGETVDDVCKAVAWLGDEDVAVHDDCFIFRHSMNPKFVSYYLQTDAFRTEKAKHVARAKVKRVSGESLARLRIPVPPLEEQERIVLILDKFAALVSDLSLDLSAELTARRQQYAHYRDQLLTFPEAA